MSSDPPSYGAPGTNSVVWVGLNTDPCKAKWLAKQGLTADTVAEKKSARPSSAPTGTRPIMANSAIGGSKDATEAVKDSAQAPRKLARPTSVPSGGRWGKSSDYPAAPTANQHPGGEPRPLAKMSCAEHFLNQKMQLPGGLPPEVFGPNGPWPANGTVKPTDLQELLYLGTSADGKGRHAYLKARNTLDLHAKHARPITVSHELGWSHASGQKSRMYRPVSVGRAMCVVPG